MASEKHEPVRSVMLSEALPPAPPATPKQSVHPYDLTYFLKVIVPMVISVVTVALSLVFWVQSYSEAHFYDIEKGNALYEQVSEVKTDLRDIREQNSDIIEALGRIEGRLDAQKE